MADINCKNGPPRSTCTSYNTMLRIFAVCALMEAKEFVFVLYEKFLVPAIVSFAYTNL